MALILSPPPNDQDVQGISWKQWFFKIRTQLQEALDLTNVSGVLDTAHGGSNVTITNGISTITIAALGSGGSTKIYEPVAVLGEITFSINGDVMMAWGGEYAS
jgi:hypothetical protein